MWSVQLNRDDLEKLTPYNVSQIKVHVTGPRTEGQVKGIISQTHVFLDEQIWGKANSAAQVIKKKNSLWWFGGQSKLSD